MFLLNSFWDSAAATGGNVTFVGSGVGGTSGDGGSVSFTLLNAANATPTLAEGDCVVCIMSRHNQSSFPISAADCRPSGYTEIASNTAATSGFGLSYKFMGASPDSSLTISNTGTGGSFGTASVAILVLRGLDPTSPIDASVVAAASGAGALPNPPSITPSSTGAIVLAAGASYGGDTAYTKPANLDATTNAFRSNRNATSGNSFEAIVGIGIYTGWASGAFDPDAFGGDTTHTGGRGYTLSFRPYAAPVFGVTLNDTIPLSYTITGSPIGTTSAWSWRKDGVEVSTTETGPTPTTSDIGAVYTLHLTMTNGPYSASVTSAGVTYSEGNLLQSSGGDAILIQSGGDNILIREFE